MPRSTMPANSGASAGYKVATLLAGIAPPEVAGADDARQALVDAMMRRVAALLPPEYRGVYDDAPPGRTLLRPAERPSAPAP